MVVFVEVRRGDLRGAGGGGFRDGSEVAGGVLRVEDGYAVGWLPNLRTCASWGKNDVGRWNNRPVV